MSVVVSDTSPLHYLILCRAERILPALFRQAIRCGLAVVDTVGLLEQSAARARGLIDLPPVVERLRQTNARLDPELVRAALARDQARREER